MEKTIFDIIVIGAGPTGLFSTFYSSYLKLKCLCIELTNNIGGQLTNLYPNKYIYDFPGHTKIKAIDLINILKKQVNEQNSQIILNTSINNYLYDNINKYFVLYDQNNIEYYAKNIIITIGVSSFEPNKIPNFEHSHNSEKVHYYLKSECDYNNKDIIVLGGGNSAVDIAHQLKTQYNSNVNLIHHRNELRANSFSIEELKSFGINIHMSTELIDWKNEYCKFKNLNNEETKLFYDFIIVQYGLKPLISPIHNWNDLLIENKKIVVNEKYETNIKNIYAAGDCIKSNNRINSIMSGIAEATIIINSLKKEITNN